MWETTDVDIQNQIVNWASCLTFMSAVASATQGGFLSPELVDKIIDEVHLFPLSDEEFEVDMDKWGNTIYKRLSTLTSCSLVCRTWLPRSRYHIFGTTALFHFTAMHPS